MKRTTVRTTRVAILVGFSLGWILNAAWAEDPSKPASASIPVDSGVKAELSGLEALLAAQQKQLDEQRQEIEKLRIALDLQRQLLEKAIPSEAARPCASGDPGCTTDQATRLPASAGETQSPGRFVALRTPAQPPPSATSRAQPAPPPPQIAEPPAPPRVEPQTTEPPGPPYVRIGDTYIMPVGFVDFTTVFRSATAGSGIGTNFGAIPFNNVPTARLTELQPSPQNSRIGFRVDSKIRDVRVIGYWESDFLGNDPGNVEVTSNSHVFRLRLYWVDLRKNKWEILAGQSWSLLTPGRTGISPLPADIFYSYVMDVNYIVGLTWGRTPQFRVVYHPSDWLAAGISLEEPQQYIGGSGGQGSITFPTNSNIATNYANQLNNGTNTLAVPNLLPDVIGKVAFDRKVGELDQHIELVGLDRTFRVFNPTNNQHFTAPAGGGALNMNFEVVRNLHLIGNFFASDGGGRWLFGSGPDLIIRGNGSISPIQAYSTTSGVEYTRGEHAPLWILRS